MIKNERMKMLEYVMKWIICMLLNLIEVIKNIFYSFCYFCRDISWIFIAIIVGGLCFSNKEIINDFNKNTSIIGATLYMLFILFLFYKVVFFILVPLFDEHARQDIFDIFTGTWVVYRDNDKIKIIHKDDMFYYTHEISGIMSIGETYIIADDEVANVYRKKGYINICERETGRIKRNIQLHNTIIRFSIDKSPKSDGNNKSENYK
ncbi:MAG: hypothetical protein SOR72_06520 [Hornefia sp.]|nr:hypothetical protein [Hornefia sp.]